MTRTEKYRNATVVRGYPYDTEILDDISERIKSNQSVVIVITKPPGTGKTYFGIAFSQIYDNNFRIEDTPTPDPSQDPSNVVFTREHLNYLIGSNSPLKRGAFILIDESQFSLGSRTFQNRDQVDLVNLLAAIRSKGFGLILVALHSSMIDKVPRDFIINYEFAMIDRGIAEVYERDFPTHATHPYNYGKGTLELPLPDPYNPETEEGCDYPDCLNCEYKNPVDVSKRCHNIRARYERRKDDFVSNAAQQKASKKNRLTDEEIYQKIKPQLATLPEGHKGKIHRPSLLTLIKNTAGHGVGNTRLIELANRAEESGDWSLQNAAKKP